MQLKTSKQKAIILRHPNECIIKKPISNITVNQYNTGECLIQYDFLGLLCFTVTQQPFRPTAGDEEKTFSDSDTKLTGVVGSDNRVSVSSSHGLGKTAGETAADFTEASRTQVGTAFFRSGAIVFMTTTLAQREATDDC